MTDFVEVSIFVSKQFAHFKFVCFLPLRPESGSPIGNYFLGGCGGAGAAIVSEI